MPTPSLKEFMEPVPVCQATAGMEAILEVFSNGVCDRLVVVDEKHSPIGVVRLCTLIPHLIRKMSKNLIEASSDFILHHFIEPIATLPAHLTPSQFWSYLCRADNISSSDEIGRHWGLVDSSGKFLGLLDSWLLLKYVAPSRDKKTSASVADERQNESSIETTGTATEETLSITGLKPLIQLIEMIPLPLRLQTTTGKVLKQNLAWCQQVGKELPQRTDNSSWKEPLEKRVPPIQESLPYAHPSEKESTRYEAAALFLNGRRRGLEPLTVQTGEHGSGVGECIESPSVHSCLFPADALRHDSSVLPTTRASSPSLKSRAIEATASTDGQAYALASGKLKNDQERVFSFLKIPFTGWGLPMLGDGTQSPNLTLVLAQDVTEQQQVAKELVTKNADLIQLKRFKDEFLACISHELKTPLTAVLGLSSLLKDQLVGQLNDRQAHYAHLIHQSGRTLMAVVNDILDLTRTETGCLDLTPEPVNIKSICDRAYLQAQQQKLLKKRPSGDSHNEIPFTLQIEDGLELIVADEMRLRQMLVHLLSNALKFTDNGGEIGLKVNRWDGWIAFTVWDTGIGIPDTQQHLIFQKFQQLENPLTRQFEGAGLGLVLTQRLARLHGGDVSFISKAGQGSEFTLLLPPSPPQGSFELGVLGDDLKDIKNSSSSSTQNSIRAGLAVQKHLNSPAHKTQPASETQNSPSQLVLIVEAAPQYITDLTEQLIHLGYRVVIARSGTEAIEKARRLQPQVVLLNPLLPHLSGWDVLTLLKSDDQTRHIPVVVTTTQAERELALLNKADGFLSLPIQEEALRQSLNHFTKHIQNACANLTILCLSPSQVGNKRLEIVGEETDSLISIHSGLNCRVLEADDIDQAELLARFWHPDVVLLDGAGMSEPLDYLEEFSSYVSLASLPLVTLDHHTTQAANQMSSLSVFPCLAPSDKDKTAAIWQVIQVAAGISCNPSILVVNLATLPDLSASYRPQTLPLNFEREVVSRQSGIDAVDSKWGQENFPSPTHKRKREPKSTRRKTRELASLQALIQYLQTAGFRGLLSRSWAEVCQQIQRQNADLLLIHLSDTLPDQAVLTALASLTNIPALPPILVLDHRLHKQKKTAHALKLDERNFTADLESVFGTIATPIQLLQEPSQSMAELLDKIHQMLGARSNF